MSARADLAIIPGLKSGRDAFAWRGIGQLQDLDINFSARDRPALVTRVLAICAEPPVEDDKLESVWRLSLAARIGGLLAIYAATRRTEELALTLHCPHPKCREAMEVSLPVPDLLELAQTAEQASETKVVLGPEVVRLRRPCGTDQRLWQQAGYADTSAAQAAVLNSLVVGEAIGADDHTALAEAMAGFDPLSCFELDVTCPECARRSDIPVDLEVVLLSALERAQARMIADVDRLARRYGWSEAEALSVPEWRRRRYLALDAEGWLP